MGKLIYSMIASLDSHGGYVSLRSEDIRVDGRLGDGPGTWCLLARICTVRTQLLRDFAPEQIRALKRFAIDSLTAC